MSLDWDLGKIRDYKAVCWLPDDTLNPVTHAMIYATMVVGINNITAANAAEFYTRLSLSDLVYGNLLQDSHGKGVPITPQDVQRHIGLHTNASPLTAPQFNKRMLTTYRQDMERKYTRETES